MKNADLWQSPELLVRTLKIIIGGMTAGAAAYLAVALGIRLDQQPEESMIVTYAALDRAAGSPSARGSLVIGHWRAAAATRNTRFDSRPQCLVARRSPLACLFPRHQAARYRRT